MKDCKTLKTKIIHADPLKQLSTEKRREQNYVPNNDVFRPATILLITVYQQKFKHTESKYTRYRRLEKRPIKLFKICIRFLFLRTGRGVFKLAMMFAYIHGNSFIRIMTHYFEY